MPTAFKCTCGREFRIELSVMQRIVRSVEHSERPEHPATAKQSGPIGRATGSHGADTPMTEERPQLHLAEEQRERPEHHATAKKSAQTTRPSFFPKTIWGWTDDRQFMASNGPEEERAPGSGTGQGSSSSWHRMGHGEPKPPSCDPPEYLLRVAERCTTRSRSRRGSRSPRRRFP